MRKFASFKLSPGFSSWSSLPTVCPCHHCLMHSHLVLHVAVSVLCSSPSFAVCFSSSVAPLPPPPLPFALNLLSPTVALLSLKRALSTFQVLLRLLLPLPLGSRHRLVPRGSDSTLSAWLIRFLSDRSALWGVICVYSSRSNGQLIWRKVQALSKCLW